MVEFNDRRGPEFHIEDGTLHVGGKPYPFARQTEMPPDLSEQPGGFRGFEVPFESGHVLRLMGRFEENGQPKFGRGSIGGGVIHEPTGQVYDWEGKPNQTASGRHFDTAEQFHDAIREVSQWPGGKHGST